MLSLTRRNTIPPGGFEYTQPETGRHFDGNLPFKGQCYLIMGHRKGNGLQRASLNEVAEDLMAATCARVPALCANSSRAMAITVAGDPPPPPITKLTPTTAPAPRPVKRCGGCGGRKAAR